MKLEVDRVFRVGDYYVSNHRIKIYRVKDYSNCRVWPWIQAVDKTELVTLTVTTSSKVRLPFTFIEFENSDRGKNYL
jgi:hypothetical protein